VLLDNGTLKVAVYGNVDRTIDGIAEHPLNIAALRIMAIIDLFMIVRF
jgi:hypothetical protein